MRGPQKVNLIVRTRVSILTSGQFLTTTFSVKGRKAGGESLSSQIRHLDREEEKLKRGEEIPTGANVEPLHRRFSSARLGREHARSSGDQEFFF